MIEAPVPEQGLVRRCTIAALASALPAAPAPRTVRSPAFARRIDAALAHADDAVPAAIRDEIAAALQALGIPLPAEPPAPPTRVAARTLRLFTNAIDWADRRSDEAARSLLESSRVPANDAAALLLASRAKSNLSATIAAGNLVLSLVTREALNAFARSLDRIADVYRSQGATAHDLMATVASEFAVEDAGPFLDVAAALDRSTAAVPRTWEPRELHDAFRREFAAESGPAPASPETPQLVESEPQRALPGRRRHFSASSLNLYADCPRKWYFRYLCAAVEDRPSSASTYGTAFHAALDALHQAYPRVAGVPPEELARRLEGEINTAFERYRTGFASEVEYRLNRRRAHRTARKYLAWLMTRARKEPFEVVGCEIEANVDLDGIDFVGYIDRVDREQRSGAVTVIDYKTGAIAGSASEYRAKINAAREFQLPYYYWAQTAAGERVRSIALVPLRDAHLEVEPIELEVVATTASAPTSRAAREAARGTISIPELERSRAKMIEVSQNLASGTIEHFPATDDPSVCRYCVYAPSCRERPPDDDRRFGR